MNMKIQLKTYNVLIEHGAASHENLLGRAGCLEALGRLQEACADAVRALGINPESTQAHKMLARVYGKLAEQYSALAAEHTKEARRIRNPQGNLGPLFD